VIAQALLDIGAPRLGLGMQRVPARRLDAVARELVEARDAPDVRRNAEVLLQELRARDDFAQYRAAAQELHLEPALARGTLGVEVHPAQIPFSTPSGMAGWT
jgi:hypothetical protein